VEIRVEDNGIGIPTQIRERIFDPFFSTKPAGSGTGLGLSISYDIVVQGHQGSLVAESKEGQGAIFTVTLPAA
jgi:signal transduction histidine kinase